MTRFNLVWVIALLFTQLSTPAHAQTDSMVGKRGLYAVVLMAGDGVSCYLAPVGILPGPEQVDARRLGVPVTFRAMWHPDHRLRVGLETGRVPMCSYRATMSWATATGERVEVACQRCRYCSYFPCLWRGCRVRSGVLRSELAVGLCGMRSTPTG